MRSDKVIIQLFLFISLSMKEAASQVTEEWASRYHGPPGNKSDHATALAFDVSGNVYVTGYSEGIGTGSYDYATIKFNSAEVQQWVSRYNGTGNGTDYAYAIAVDGNGNSYVTGGSIGHETGYYVYATVKYDANGVEQWVARYYLGGSIARAIAVDATGNVYVTGESGGAGTYNDYTTIKYNSSGQQLWLVRYNSPYNAGDEASVLKLDASGNVYITGTSHNTTTFYPEYATVKYNSSGIQQWASRYNGPGNGTDAVNAIDIDGFGNVYVTGRSEGIGSNADYSTIKYISSGDTVWVRRYNGTGNAADIANALSVDGLGNVYVTGYSSRSITNYDYLTIKYNAAGDSVWVKRYNGTSNYRDYANSLALDGSGNVYVTGFSREIPEGDCYTTIKYNSGGIQQWLKSYSAPGITSDDARAVKVDNSGNVYITGYSSTASTLFDYGTVKYSQTSPVHTLTLTAYIEGFYNSVLNDMISDTARVYLRNSSSPYNRVDSSKGILSSSGTGTFLFSNALNGVNYYLEVKHRNTIETWSSSGNSFTSGTLTYNFSTNSSQAYGNNMMQADAAPIRFAIYSGDVNQDGTIDLTDGSLIDNDALSFASGYLPTDVNGDDVTDITDAVLADNNGFNFVSKITP